MTEIAMNTRPDETKVSERRTDAPRRAVPPKRKSGPLEGHLAVGVVEALYVILLGFLFARLVYTLITPLSTPSVVPVRESAEQTADVGAIVRYDPFFGGQAAAPVQPVARAVEETRLNLKLVGTFVTGDNPSATIQTEGGRQARFYLGDEVISGVTVEEVRPDQVIISRRGVSEALSLEGRERRTFVSTGTAQAVASGNADQSMIAQFVRISPNEGGGLVLRAGSNPTIFNAAGLIDGDVLLAVNGRPLPSGVPQAQGSLLRMLSRGPVTLTINRSGVTLDLVLDPTGLQ